MSGVTAGPARKQDPSSRVRVSYAIVVSTLPTLKLRIERLDASTALCVCSGTSNELPQSLWDVLKVVPIELGRAREDARGSASAGSKP